MTDCAYRRVHWKRLLLDFRTNAGLSQCAVCHLLVSSSNMCGTNVSRLSARKKHLSTLFTGNDKKYWTNCISNLLLAKQNARGSPMSWFISLQLVARTMIGPLIPNQNDQLGLVTECPCGHFPVSCLLPLWQRCESSHRSPADLTIRL